MARTLVTTAHPFAATLAARHVRAQPWTPPVASVLRRTTAGPQTVVHHTNAITLAPHLELTVRSFTPASRSTPRPDAAIAARYERREPVGPWAGPQPVHPSWETTRPAAPVSNPSAQSTRGPAMEMAPSLPRVLRHGPELARARDAVPEPRPREHAPSAPSPASPAVAHPVTLTPVEVSRLTDQVMHTLDRRLAAFRERHGRL